MVCLASRLDEGPKSKVVLRPLIGEKTSFKCSKIKYRMFFILLECDSSRHLSNGTRLGLEKCYWYYFSLFRTPMNICSVESSLIW